MKFNRRAVEAIVFVAAAKAGLLVHADKTDGANNSKALLRQRILPGQGGGRPMTKPCTVEVVMKLRIPGEELPDGEPEEEYECVVDASDSPNGQSNQAYPLELDPDQTRAMREKLRSGELVPGESTVFADGMATVSEEGGVSVPPGIAVALGKGQGGGPQGGGRRRKLANYNGDRYFLFVRVTDSTGKVWGDNAELMGDNVFGLYGDPNNLKSQMEACSFGKYTVNPGPSGSQISGEEATDSNGNPIPGVIEVTINIPLEGNGRSTIRNAVTTAVQNKLEFSLPGPFDHVLYSLEGCYLECGWAAYAYINSWNQVYQGGYYGLTGVLMHEHGHNLDLAHSGGLDGQTYTDHTCLMGNPLYSDDVGRMCFNPAKNWLLQNSGRSAPADWYKTDQGVVAMELLDPNTDLPANRAMIGVGEWDKNTDPPKPVVLKIETFTSTDYYVGFNRAAGANSQNDEADDEVTVIESNDGTSYKQTFLKSHMVTGESWTTPQGVIVEPTCIDITSQPGVACVCVRQSTQTCPPCSCSVAPPPPTVSPSAGPTSSPTASPTSVPTPAPVPTASPTSIPTSGPTDSPTSGPTRAPVPTESPTSVPTSSPTTSPTMAPVPPTASPTTSPTKNPTTSPTITPCSSYTDKNSCPTSGGPNARCAWAKTDPTCKGNSCASTCQDNGAGNIPICSAVGESCVDNEDCCGGECSGGSPSQRKCLQ